MVESQGYLFVTASCYGSMCVHVGIGFIPDDDPKFGRHGKARPMRDSATKKKIYHIHMCHGGLKFGVPSGNKTIIPPQLTALHTEQTLNMCYRLYKQLEHAELSGSGKIDLLGKYIERDFRDGDCTCIRLVFCDAELSVVKWDGPMGEKDSRGVICGMSCATFVIVVFRSALQYVRGDTKPPTAATPNGLLNHQEWVDRRVPIRPHHVANGAESCTPTGTANFDEIDNGIWKSTP